MTSWGGFVRPLGVDEPGGEGVASADAVDDVDLVAAAEVGLAAVIDRAPTSRCARPRSSRASVMATPWNPNRSVRLRGDLDVAVAVELALADLAAGGLDAEDLLGVLLVGDAVIDRAASGSLIDLLGLRGAPELLAIVQVAAHRQAELLGGPGPSASPGRPARRGPGVMPVKWNHCGPSRIVGQSSSAGSIVAIALPARS